MSLWINRGPMETPEINTRRAVFVLGRIDEILSWEKSKEQEKDVRFVELGEYLCEVRSKQHWRVEDLSRLINFWRSALRTPGGRRTTLWRYTNSLRVFLNT